MNPQIESEPVALEEVTLAFQKAMARAAQVTARTIADTPAMRYGARQVYAVRRLEVDLCVGAEVQRLEQDGRPTERVAVRFDPAPERAARLRFAIEGAPLAEALQEPALFLLLPRAYRGGLPLEEREPLRAGDELELTAALHAADGSPVPAASVVLEVARLAVAPEGSAPWLPLPERRRLLRPRVTDGEGLARFRVRLPALESPLLRVRGQCLLARPGAEPLLLTERSPQFRAVDPLSPAGPGTAWRDALLSPEEEVALPAPLRERSRGDE